MLILSREHQGFGPGRALFALARYGRRLRGRPIGRFLTATTAQLRRVEPEAVEARVDDQPLSVPFLQQGGDVFLGPAEAHHRLCNPVRVNLFPEEELKPRPPGRIGNQLDPLRILDGRGEVLAESGEEACGRRVVFVVDLDLDTY